MQLAFTKKWNQKLESYQKARPLYSQSFFPGISNFSDLLWKYLTTISIILGYACPRFRQFSETNLYLLKSIPNLQCHELTESPWIKYQLVKRGNYRKKVWLPRLVTIASASLNDLTVRLSLILNCTVLECRNTQFGILKKD